MISEQLPVIPHLEISVDYIFLQDKLIRNSPGRIRTVEEFNTASIGLWEGFADKAVHLEIEAFQL